MDLTRLRSVLIRSSAHPRPRAIRKPASSDDAALRFLFERIDYERTRTMPYDPMRLWDSTACGSLLERLGNPQQGMPIVHVAGTKGKGSTSAMIAAMLSAAGYRTGLFTSPHLDRIEERMAVDGRLATADELVELVRAVRPAVEAMDAETGSGSGQGRGRQLASSLPRHPHAASRPTSRSPRPWPCCTSPGPRSTRRCWRSGWAGGSMPPTSAIP